MPARATTAVLCLAVGCLSPLDAQLTPTGHQRWNQGDLGSLVEAGDRFGAALAVGDFDGDSYDDLVVGLPGEDVGAVVDAGSVLIVYGAPSGLDGAGALPVFSLHQDVAGVLGVAEASDQFGATLAVGDFNGDTFDDLAVGVPLEDVEISPGVIVADGGVVHVFYGSLGGIITAGNQAFAQENLPAAAVSQTGDQFGAALATCDVSFVQDAVDDLAIGIPGDNFGGLNSSGAAAGLMGSPGGLTASGSSYFGAAGFSTPPAPGDRFGSAIGCGTYGSGESSRLIAIGAPLAEASGAGSSAGIVRVTTESGSWETSFPNAGGRSGASLAFIPSPDTLQFDLLIGIPGSTSGVNEESGRVYSETTGRGFAQGLAGLSEASEPFDRFGEVIATGDWNGDGRPDVAYGVPGENLRDGLPDTALDAGTVHVLFGQYGFAGTAAHQVWNWDDPTLGFAAHSNDKFGAALAGGDFDGDGVDDLVIGAPGAEWNDQAGTGLIQILYGEARLVFADNFEFGSIFYWSGDTP